MSKGHPYRYDQGPYDRHRSRYAPPDGRRDIGSPYKRQRRASSSGNDFTTFSYEDCHQEVGLGNFNDFSAINREAILPRDRRRDGKQSSSQSMSTLTVQTSRATSEKNKPTSKISPLSVNISSSLPSKPITTGQSASGSLLSSFQHPDRQSTHRSYGSQPTSPYKPASSSASQYAPRVEVSLGTGHTISGAHHMTKPNQPMGLLMQASPSDVNTSYAASTTVTTVKEDVYQPKVEAVSPTNSEAEVEKSNDQPSKEEESRSTELIKQMEKVDREITEVEKKINVLKEKQAVGDPTLQKTLEDELSQDALQAEEEEEKENESVKQENGIEEKNEVEVPEPPEPKEKTLIERIYEENRKKAAAAHERFAKIGIPLPTTLPLYNQPSDLPFYEENRKKARAVQLKLVKYFQRKRKDKQIKQRALQEKYRFLHAKWMEKVEKMENNPKRKSKEGRVRDFYEKIFPEIKRHREQTERFSRIGSRTNWGMSVRSDAEYEEILQDLEEKERHEKHMRELAVDIPSLLDEDQRRVKYINTNGLIKDLKVYVEQRKMVNIWTEKEKEIFKEKYIQAPKDFEYIAKFIPNKSVKDCVLHYYRTKRTGNYKKLAKKSIKRKRLPNSTGKDDVSKPKILKPRSEGYRSESDIEDEEPFDMDSDGSEGSSSRVPISTSANPAIKITTPQTGTKAEAASVETPRWSKSEREIAIEGLRLHGRNWTAISQMVKTKTEAQCKNFYFNYKRKLDLENVVAEHNAAKVVQRQESEETISASEASDDNYDIPEEKPSIARSKQNVRETRSQTAERRTDTGPTLRNSRSQRNSRNKSSDGKPSRGLPDDPSNTVLHEVENPVATDKPKMSTVCSDEARIIVVDTIDPQGQSEVVWGNVGTREHSRTQVSPTENYNIKVPVSSSSSEVTAQSSSLTTPSQAVVKETATSSDRQLGQNLTETHSSRTLNAHLTSTAESQKVTVNTPCTVMYPNAPYRPLTMETPVAGRHSEALLNLVRSRAAAESAGLVDNPTEEPGDKKEKEKLKKNRQPDPQLPKFEQSEAIGIFNRFSPCIPPDTTSIQQVRTQRLPHASFHPPGIPMHQFVPHIGPPGNPHFPGEMIAIPFPHGAAFDPMFHPQFVEYIHPGMEHNLFSARLREEAARANPAAAMWPPMEHQGIIFAPHPPFMLPMEPSTPAERISRRRESGHELVSPVPSTRCRSVETPSINPRARTPDQSNSKPMNQQRSTSLTDVHSWSASGSSERHASPSRPARKPSPKDPGTDQVKSYKPFNVLLNAAVEARPMNEQESQRGRDALKTAEAERIQPQFTRQSCVVTNTSVLQMSSGPKEASQAHGISSGLAPPQPPPLLSITGTQPPRFEEVLNPRPIEIVGRMGSQDSPRVLNPREMVKPREPTSFSHSPKEQPPPPLVRDTPPMVLRRTPPSRDTSLQGRPIQDFLRCGCRSTEPCKHQLYSQEVPYVQRVDTRNKREVEQRQPAVENIPSREVEPSPRKAIFRPWTEHIKKDSAKPSSPLKTVSPPVQSKQTGSALLSQKGLTSSPRGSVNTPPPHPYSQQPGVLISHPNPSHQTGEVVPRSESHARLSQSKHDPLSQERGPTSVSHTVPQEATPRPSLNPQVPVPQPSSSSSHLQRQQGSSSVLHPPRLLAPRNRSPQQSNFTSTSPQPGDLFTARNLRDPSIIKSTHPPPLMSGAHPNTVQPAHPIPYFPHHAGTSHPSQTVVGMPYPIPISMSHLIHDQPTIQDPRGLSTVIQTRDSHPSPFLPLSLSHYAPFPPDLLHSGAFSSYAHDNARLPRPPLEKSRPSSDQSRPSSDQSRPSPDQSRSFLEHSHTDLVQPRTSQEQSHNGSEKSRASLELSRTFAEQSRTSLEQSRKLVEQSRVGAEISRVDTEQSCVDTEQSRVDTEQSRVDTEQSRPFAEQSRARTDQPNTGLTLSSSESSVPSGTARTPTEYRRPVASRSVSPGRQTVSAGPLLAREEHELGKTSVDRKDRPKSPFNKQAELLQPNIDAPVDIQRHVNPSYAAKSDDVSSLRDDVTTFSVPTNNQLNQDTETLSPPATLEKSSTNDPPHAIHMDSRSSDVVPHHSHDVSPRHPGAVSPNSRDGTPHPHDVSPKDVVQYPNEETFDSREDSRSIAGSSSIGFESPDDEDHELRMRYLPSGDTCEDSLYQDQHQRLESDSDRNPLYGSPYPNSGQHLESDDEGGVSERHGDEFSNTDATCIPTDSTYIGDSERSAGENVHSRHDYGSSGDMIDSTVSDLSEFEQPAGGSPERRLDEPEEGDKLVNKQFTLMDESALNASKSGDRNELWKQREHLEDIGQPSVQDETVSGHEGDNDATEDEAEYVGTSGGLVDCRGEAMDTQGGEVDSSENVKVIKKKVDSEVVGDYRSNIVDNDDRTVMDSAGRDTISRDTGRHIGAAEGEPKTSLNIMKTSEDSATREQAGHSMDNMDEVAIQEGKVDKMSDGTESIDHPTNGENTKEKVSTRWASENEVTTNEAVAIESGTDDNALSDDVVETLNDNNTLLANTSELSSKNTKEVSSSSDTGTGEVSQKNVSLEDEEICEAIQSSNSQHEVVERSARDEALVEATDRVDSSTDRDNYHRRNTEEEMSFIVGDVRMNLPASPMSNQRRVTSSNEHVEGSDEGIKNQGGHMEGNEHVRISDEHVRVSPEHVGVPDEHGTVENVTGQNELVMENAEHADSRVTEEQSQTKEGNEVSEVKPAVDNSALDDNICDSGMGTPDDRDTVVTSVGGTTHRDVQEREGNGVQHEDTERVHDGPNWDSTIESTSSTGPENIYEERNILSNEAVSSDQCIPRVSTTDDNVDDRSSPGQHQQTNEEHYVENINNDITSTVEETNIASQHDDTDISSTFDTARLSLAEPRNESETLSSFVSTSNIAVKHRDDVATSSSVAMRRDDGATSSITEQNDDVATSSVAMQQDNVSMVSDVPNISDVSSSDTSEIVETTNEHIDFADSAENLNPAESRTDGSEADFPDSAENAHEALSRTSRFEVDSPDSGHIADRRPSDLICSGDQGIASLSRRSSEDSEEPSTTNLNERTVSDCFANDHENISENEAESLTNYDESEFRTERNSGVNNNIVDSSTVSPVSFTDDVSHADDVTAYLGSNRNITASTTDNIVDTTEYLGLNRDSGSLSTPEGTVGTTVGITSSTKYDITVEAISSDEELEEGEIAETPDDVTRNNAKPCDVSPEPIITSSSGSYYPPLDTIPISPPADSDEPSSSSFLDFGTYPYSSTQLAGSSTQVAGSSTQVAGSSTHVAGSSTQLAGSSIAGSTRVTHSVFPFSALNVRSAPNSNCSSPVAVGHASGCNTPIRFQQADSTPIRFQPADSSNMLTPQYEPLSDDESSESHDTDERRHSSIRDTDSN